MFLENECQKYLEELVNACRTFDLNVNVITYEFVTHNGK